LRNIDPIHRLAAVGGAWPDVSGGMDMIGRQEWG